MTRFGKFLPIWLVLKSVLIFCKGNWQNFEPTLANFHCCKWPNIHHQVTLLVAISDGQKKCNCIGPPPVSSGIPFEADEAVTAILGSCSCSHRQASDVLDKGNCIKAYFSLFTQCAFDAYGLHLCRDMKYSNLLQDNNLPQAAVRNASHVIWGHCC